MKTSQSSERIEDYEKVPVYWTHFKKDKKIVGSNKGLLSRGDFASLISIEEQNFHYQSKMTRSQGATWRRMEAATASVL